MRTSSFVISLFVAAALPGCEGKRPQPDSGANTATAPPKSGGSVESLLGKDSPPAPPPPVVPEPNTAPSSSTPAAPAPVFTPRVEEAMGQLTMFVQQYEMEFKKMPSNLNELVRPGYLPYIFPPPKGKKWVIDTKAKQVKLVDTGAP